MQTNKPMEVIDIHKIGIDKLIFIGIGALFIIEQIFYWFLGSYPYRYGILLKTIAISNFSITIKRKDRKHADRLLIKANDRKSEIYVRYRYPTAIIGPLIFVGQIKYNETNKLIIRIGPISAIFILYLITFFLFSDGLYGFINTFIIIALIVWFYFRFYNVIQSISPVLRSNKRS